MSDDLDRDAGPASSPAQSPTKTSPEDEGTIEYYAIGASVTVEDVDLYNKGGLYPVHIGDILDGRFEVVHKLGHGGFSTVWLCLNTTNNEWLAVKIMTAEHSSQGNDNAIMEHLRNNASAEQLEDSHVAISREFFWLEGVNGRHLCSVTDVFGWTVSNWSLFQDPVEENTAVSIKNVSRQIAEAIRFLHRRGICHGDIKPANILMKLQGLNGLTKNQVLELTGEPELIPIETVSGDNPQPHAPEYCVAAVPSEWCDKLVSESIAIIDFGEAFHIKNSPATTGIPTLYAAPEILFEGAPGLSSDIWSLACTIYEIKTNDFLFGSLWGSGVSEILSEIEQYLGPLPEPYRSVYRKQQLSQLGKSPEDTEDTTPDTPTKVSSQGDETGSPTKEYNPSYLFEKSLGAERQLHRDVPDSEDLPPEQRQQTITYKYPEDEVKSLADLFKKMLKYNPAVRISIEAALCHPWFKGPQKRQTGNSKVPKHPWASILGLIIPLVLSSIAWIMFTSRTPASSHSPSHFLKKVVEEKIETLTPTGQLTLLPCH